MNAAANPFRHSTTLEEGLIDRDWLQRSSTLPALR
jgi:hypothetical protein